MSNHIHFARSIASAAVVAMLAVSAPAVAQTSQATPANAQATKHQQPLVQTNMGPTTPVQCGASSPGDTNENRGSKGSRPIESSGSASNAPSGPTTSGAGTSDTENADCPSGGMTSAPGSMTNHGYRHAPNGEPARTSSASTNMNSRNVKHMTNTLQDNPNGSNWMTKYNRPNVVATHRHHRTNALGMTSRPPKP